jgi:hypothetical protein
MTGVGGTTGGAVVVTAGAVVPNVAPDPAVADPAVPQAAAANTTKQALARSCPALIRCAVFT